MMKTPAILTDLNIPGMENLQDSGMGITTRREGYKKASCSNKNCRTL